MWKTFNDFLVGALILAIVAVVVARSAKTTDLIEGAGGLVTGLVNRVMDNLK